jgi:hypothetical protein
MERSAKTLSKGTMPSYHFGFRLLPVEVSIAKDKEERRASSV